MECSARRVNGSAHCRSSTTRATGRRRRELLQDIHDGLDDQPPLVRDPRSVHHPSRAGLRRPPAGGRARHAGDRARPARPPRPRSEPAADGPARPRRTRPRRPGTPAPGRTPALRRSDGTCQSQPRPRPARSVPVPSRHPRRRRAARPARPPGRPTGPGTRLRPLPCRDHRGHTNRPPTTSVDSFLDMIPREWVRRIHDGTRRRGARRRYAHQALCDDDAVLKRGASSATLDVKRPEFDGHCTQNAWHITTAIALQQTSAERRICAASLPTLGNGANLQRERLAKTEP